jgi:hypothetical protein
MEQFYNIFPWPKYIKFVIYECNKVVFVPGKPLQPSLMFQVLHSEVARVDSWPYPQTLG